MTAGHPDAAGRRSSALILVLTAIAIATVVSSVHGHLGLPAGMTAGYRPGPQPAGSRSLPAPETALKPSAR
jgi:hypothetical protein